MAKRPYRASSSETKGRSALSISFRHPLRKDPRGKVGLKIRRGLGTSDAAEAERLVGQMNELLAAPSLHSLAKRPEAARRFSPVVVSAFYDAIEPPDSDPFAQRNEVLPLPGRDEKYARVLLVGTTGAGKTSLLRHLIGSHPERDRFPSTATARTTIADIEVITDADAEEYEAAVTFFNEWSTLTNISECIADACLAVWQGAPEEKVAERFLHHRDQRFRLSYILGSYSSDVAEDEDSDWAYEGELEEESEADDLEDKLTADERAELRAVLGGYLERIRGLAQQARVKLEADLEVSVADLKGSERDAAQELFEDLVQGLPDFDDLVNDIRDDILSRFEGHGIGDLRRAGSGWPVLWIFRSADREEFLREIRWFSSNYAPAFGRLLTPLVEGIRVRGSFGASFSDRPQRLVLIDGQGLGHTPDSASSVTTHITGRYADVDVILLVDSAKQPMQAAPLSVLRSVGASGHQRKLAIAFTHFDQVTGANLRTFGDKKAHVMGAVMAGLESLRDVLTSPVVNALERDLELRSFMLGWLDRPISRKSKGVVGEIERLLAFCRDSLLPDIQLKASPVYDSAGLLFAVQAGTRNFQKLWEARLGFGSLEGVKKEHWARIKALNRRVALSLDRGEYQHLKPAAELLARLTEAITKYLNEPSDWYGPPDDNEREKAIAAVQRNVFAALSDYVAVQLLEHPLPHWMVAYEYRGGGSTYDRAHDIKAIYEEAAPVPGEVMNREAAGFLRDIRKLVHNAIRDAGGSLESEIAG